MTLVRIEKYSECPEDAPGHRILSNKLEQALSLLVASIYVVACDQVSLLGFCTNAYDQMECLRSLYILPCGILVPVAT